MTVALHFKSGIFLAVVSLAFSLKSFLQKRIGIPNDHSSTPIFRRVMNTTIMDDQEAVWTQDEQEALHMVKGSNQ